MTAIIRKLRNDTQNDERGFLKSLSWSLDTVVSNQAMGFLSEIDPENPILYAQCVIHGRVEGMVRVSLRNDLILITREEGRLPMDSVGVLMNGAESIPKCVCEILALTNPIYFKTFLDRDGV